MSYNCYDDEDNVDRYKNYGWKSGSSNTNYTTNNAYFPNRNPWDNQEEGCWVIRKSKGCTSMKKVKEQEGTEELEAFHYAMAVCYDIMVNEISNTVNSGKPYSYSDIALNTIEAIGKVISQRRKDVGI
jgi:hypothetical protein